MKSDKPNPNSHPKEELVREDDAVIGRAFRYSFIALVGIVLIAALSLLVIFRKPEAAPSQVTPLSPPVSQATASLQPPNVTFTEITSVAGISFRHDNGAAGEKLLPETMGGGVAFLDFDGDADQDLLLVNCSPWPWADTTRPSPTHALYENDGTGKFRNVTSGSGLDGSFYGMGAAIGDFDNDGKPDIYLTAVGRNHLFRNEGSGKFSDVTQSSGVSGEEDAWSTAATWFDLENDGDLDLFVANYVRWSKEIDFEVGFKIDGVNRAYGPPMNFQGTFPYLFRNDGAGRFTDISKSAGVQVVNPVTKVPAAKSLGVAPIDLDRDGYVDLVVANDTVQNFLFHNQKNGSFREIGALSGLAFDNYGNTRGAMGIDTGYYRNDSMLGIAIGNFANEMTALYTSQKDPLTFTDAAIPEGIGPASRLLLKFGIIFLDYDLDGRLDVLTANGHLEEEISKVQQSQHYKQPPQLFWNGATDSGPAFIPVRADHVGNDLLSPMVGRGCAFADIDGDGDLDVLITEVGGSPRLLRNDLASGRHWLRLKLVGTRSNRDALGAVVALKTGSATLTRVVTPTRGYLSQSELPLTFGLANDNPSPIFDVRWPSGQRQTLEGLQPNRLHVIHEPNPAPDTADHPRSTTPQKEG